MKRSIRMITITALCALLNGSLSAQPFTERVKSWIPKNPSTSLNLPSIPSVGIPHFNLSALRTPEAVSNALQRIASVFKLLSPKTLVTIQKNQLAKLQQNIEAYAENPTWANKGTIAANALALSAATIALTGEAAVVASVGYVVGKKTKEKLVGEQEKA